MFRFTLPVTPGESTMLLPAARDKACSTAIISALCILRLMRVLGRLLAAACASGAGAGLSMISGGSVTEKCPRGECPCDCFSMAFHVSEASSTELGSGRVLPAQPRAKTAKSAGKSAKIFVGFRFIVF